MTGHIESPNQPEDAKLRAEPEDDYEPQKPHQKIEVNGATERIFVRLPNFEIELSSIHENVKSLADLMANVYEYFDKKEQPKKGVQYTG